VILSDGPEAEFTAYKAERMKEGALSSCTLAYMAHIASLRLTHNN